MGRPGNSQMALHRTGKPIEDAFIESCKVLLRDGFLNETLFSSLSHARLAFLDWRSDYNSDS
ncbi:integrase core domain-containing protein [Agrobacterium sp. DKPNP3]|uniref:integrase core domain-containing protein n=1 Tax=Agrobacterium sp. DKPNP3 TaxID=3457323 RepID=UPI004044FF0F